WRASRLRDSRCPPVVSHRRLGAREPASSRPGICITRRMSRSGRSGAVGMRTIGWMAVLLLLHNMPAHAQERDGRFLFNAYCVACHGSAARGDGVEADLFSPPPANLRSGILAKYTDDQLVERIRHGRPLDLAHDPARLQ